MEFFSVFTVLLFTLLSIVLLVTCIVFCRSYSSESRKRPPTKGERTSFRLSLSIGTIALLMCSVSLFVASVGTFGGLSVLPGNVGVGHAGEIYTEGIYFHHNKAILISRSNTTQYSENANRHSYDPLSKSGRCRIRYSISDFSKLQKLHELNIGSKHFVSIDSYLYDRMKTIITYSQSLSEAERGVRELCSSLRECGLNVEASLTLTFPDTVYEYQRHLDQAPLPVEPSEE